MTLYFPVIGRLLSWKDGTRVQVRIGIDAIIGCGEGILFPKDLIL